MNSSNLSKFHFVLQFKKFRDDCKSGRRDTPEGKKISTGSIISMRMFTGLYLNLTAFKQPRFELYF